MYIEDGVKIAQVVAVSDALLTDREFLERTDNHLRRLLAQTIQKVPRKRGQYEYRYDAPRFAYEMGDYYRGMVRRVMTVTAHKVD